MKLILNADDFGLCEGVNYGIVHAHRHGIVRSTTLMVGMPGEQHAVALSRDNPELQIGIHLRLTAGSPISKGATTLTDSGGSFKRYSDFFGNDAMSASEIERELRAQIDRFQQLGLTLSHIDSHHHCHNHPSVLPIVVQLASELGVPMRTADTDQVTQYGPLSYRFSDRFYGEVKEQTLLEIVDTEQAQTDGNRILEVMCHPAYLDPALQSVSSYALQRVQETAVLTSASLAEALIQRGVLVTDYRTVKTMN